MVSSLIVSIGYIAAQMLSDIGSLQIIRFFGFSMDAGTLIYPITFTLRDLAHKTLGLKNVRILVISAGVINLFMAGYFWLVTKFPPDTAAGSSTMWGQVLSPVWRITLASIAAELFSELTDTEVYRFWVERVTQRYEWMRVLVSNSVSVPLDSLVFCFFAFYGTMPTEVVWSIFWSNVFVKGAVTLLSMPMIYLVRDRS